MDPEELRYSREHEWVKMEEDEVALVGITEYAQDELGDVVFVGLPKPGTQVAQSQRIGEIESVKAVSDLYCPIGGTVLEINPELEDHPELVNEDPLGAGWLLRVRMGDVAELESLMFHEQYQAMLQETD
jgi:glycine cleavage system H protein